MTPSLSRLLAYWRTLPCWLPTRGKKAWPGASGLLSAWCGCALLAAVLAAALFAPWLTPYAAEGMGAPNMSNKLLPPSLAHPFGADEMGRDVLARVLFGARPCLSSVALVIGGSALAGIFVGLSAGYAGGFLDAAAMRVADVFLAFPPLLLAILLVTMWGGGMLTAALALALVWWPSYALLVRGEVLRLRRQPYVEAAQATGAPPLHIVRHHVLPNALGPLFTQAAVDAGAVILLAAGLSFVGLGPQPPAADWGVMINSGRLYLLSGHWWVAAWPSIAILLTSLGFALLGDSLRA